MGGEGGGLRLHDQPHLHDVGGAGVLQAADELPGPAGRIAFDEGAAADDTHQAAVQFAERAADGIAGEVVGGGQLPLCRHAVAVGPITGVDLPADVQRHVMGGANSLRHL